MRGRAVISYARAGSGPPVLLVQGVGVVGNGWKPQVDGLSDRFTLLSFDNRGIGESTLQGKPSIEDMAADALAIADAEGVEQFHLAGHSMGGLIAQHIALAARPRVMSLALLCTFLRGPQGAAMSPSLLLSALRMRIGTRAMRRNAFTQIVMPAAYLKGIDRERLADNLAPLFGRDLAEQPPIVISQVRAMSRFDASARLSELAAIPTMVVSATEDRIARPEYGRALAAIPGARYVEIPDAGHGVPIQLARRVNELLAEHWVSAASRQPSAAS
jgi:aminoacrylate hydrolase